MGPAATRTVQYWHWKHSENPAGTSLGLAAYDGNGRLVALRPFMRYQVALGGSVVQAVRAVDTAVAPECRRQGIFSDLTAQSLSDLKESGINLIFNTPNKRSAPGYNKLGWRLLGHPTVWVRICRPHSLLGRMLVAKSSAPNLALPNHWRRLSDVDNLHSFCRLAALSEGCVRLQKDLAYVEWRYRRHPTADYRLVDYPDSGGAEASAILRFDNRGRHNGVVICELNARSSASLRSLVRSLVQESDCDYLVFSGSEISSASLLAAGFIPYPWQNVVLAVRPLRADQECSSLHNRRGWKFSLGDMEGL